MLNIIIAKINIFSDKRLNVKLNKTYILTLSKDIFTITSDKTLKPILAIKKPLYIKLNKDKFIIKDNKKDIIYTIEIIKEYKKLECSTEIISENKESIHLEEFNVKDYVLQNFKEIFPNFQLLKTEYVTPYWNIDILAISGDWRYKIIELKKKSTDLKTIDQVCKYWFYFDENEKDNDLFVVWINENKKNKEYALKKWVKIIDIKKSKL